MLVSMPALKHNGAVTRSMRNPFVSFYQALRV
jgi:hypothetical protein